MAAVEARGATKVYGTNTVLDELDFEVGDEEFVAITGRSGAGKSTLLRLITGTEKPTAGSVTADRRQAISFQEPRLVPWLKVWDNVTLGMNLPKAKRRHIAEQALADVQIEGKADEWPLSLSGGQAQRVSLARAIVRQPKLLLLDEPFGALDALTRLGMQDLISDLRAEHHWSVVMVTHDVGEAVRLADRVVVLGGDGKIVHERQIGRAPASGDRFADSRPPDYAEHEAALAAALA